MLAVQRRNSMVQDLHTHVESLIVWLVTRGAAVCCLRSIFALSRDMHMLM